MRVPAFWGVKRRFFTFFWASFSSYSKSRLYCFFRRSILSLKDLISFHHSKSSEAELSGCLFSIHWTDSWELSSSQSLRSRYLFGCSGLAGACAGELGAGVCMMGSFVWRFSQEYHSFFCRASMFLLLGSTSMDLLNRLFVCLLMLLLFFAFFVFFVFMFFYFKGKSLKIT